LEALILPNWGVQF